MQRGNPLEVYIQSRYTSVREQVESGESDTALLDGELDPEAQRLADRMQIPSASLRMNDCTAAPKIQEAFSEGILNQHYNPGSGPTKKDAAIISIPIDGDPQTIELVLSGVTFGAIPHPQVDGQELRFTLPIEGRAAPQVQTALDRALGDIGQMFEGNMRQVAQINAGALVFARQQLAERQKRLAANQAVVDWLNSR